jgi:tetratricopeptide (TPR) repeat protein
LDAAREVLHQELAEYERLGRYVVRDELLCYLAEVECRAGSWEVAARHAQEACEIDVESGRVLGQGHMLFPRALVAALTGDVDAARSDAEEGLRRCLRNEDILDATCHRAVLGFLELSLSNPTAAMEQLEPVLAFLDEMGSPEPGIIPVVPDAVETLISLGRLDEAEALLDRLERQGRALDRPWAIATAGRGRGLLSAARGDLSTTRSALEQALVDHRCVPQPFELARTLLVKGEVERRAKQKRAARSTLEQALGLFQTLGAPLWAQRARDGLARVGGAMLPSGELTPTEQRIAAHPPDRHPWPKGFPRFLTAPQDLACCRGQAPIARSEDQGERDAAYDSNRQFSGLGWRRVVIVATMVSAMVGGVAAVAGHTTASEPDISEPRLQAPWPDPSCRELIAIPKPGWVCEHRRP